MTMTEYVPNPYADALAAIIADSLPDRVTLVDPDYRDELSPPTCSDASAKGPMRCARP